MYCAVWESSLVVLRKCEYYQWSCAELIFPCFELEFLSIVHFLSHACTSIYPVNEAL